MRKQTVITTFILILALGAFFRFFLITDTPPGLYPDEAMNGSNALEAIETGNFKLFYPDNNGREGLFINIQTLSVKLFGNTAWALRGVSAVFGTLTILGVFLLTKELFREKSQIANYQSPTISNDKKSKFKTRILNLFGIWNFEFGISRGEIIALLSSFFLATSYWHVNFSRIGFRAITVPFFATFALFFLLRGLRQKNIWHLAAAGIFAGLGFHTYIAYRFMPFVFAVPLFFALIDWQKKEGQVQSQKLKVKKSIECTPCAALFFIFVALVVALPIGIYFMQNPGDFLGRGGQVSIFAGESPIKEFLISNAKTIGMFFVRGDCNFRHNFNCMPELHPIAGFFFLLGIVFAIYDIRKNGPDRRALFLLGAWTLFMTFPATLTREGMPHALRSIGLIPPVMILAGFGAWGVWEACRNFLERQKIKWPQFSARLTRMQRELAWVIAVVILFIPIATYDNYFLRWRNHPNTYFAFATDLWHLGQYLNNLSPDIKKYIVVNVSGAEVNFIPLPAETLKYATNTVNERGRREKNITYVLPKEILTKISVGKNEKVLVTFLNPLDRQTTSLIQKKFPDLRVWVPSDFAVLKNY